jgi:hypothetical protein
MIKSYTIDKCPLCAGSLRQRSSEQNAALHSLISDIAKQKQWAGQWLDVTDWKRLLTMAWERAEGGHVRAIPALDGAGFDVLYRRTSRMSKQDMSSLLEYVTSYAVEQGIKLSAPESWAERMEA